MMLLTALGEIKMLFSIACRRDVTSPPALRRSAPDATAGVSFPAVMVAGLLSYGLAPHIGIAVIAFSVSVWHVGRSDHC